MSNYSIRLPVITRKVQRGCLFSDMNFKLVSVGNCIHLEFGKKTYRSEVMKSLKLYVFTGLEDSALLSSWYQSYQRAQPSWRQAVRQCLARPPDASLVCSRLQTQPLRIHQQPLGLCMFTRILWVFGSQSQPVNPQSLTYSLQPGWTEPACGQGTNRCCS